MSSSSGSAAPGAAAALEAVAAGADVLVLERLSGPGGSSAQSGGEIYLGGGTPVQKACGFEDSADDMYAYLRAALGPHADEEKLRLYCDESVEHFEWLRRQGVSFQETLYDAPGWMAPTTDGLMWLGENAWPYSTLARPAPRGHRPPTENYGGWLLMEKLAAAVDAAGARIHTDTRAAALVIDESGQVAGVTARHFGEEVRYRARKGVILTTGGFVDNEEMLAAHAPVLLGHGKVSDGGDDGSGIRMACALGAAVRRMGMVEAALLAPPSLAYHGILVNALGQRFINEDVYPGAYSHAALLHEPAPWWVIIDQEGFEAVAATEEPGVQPQHVAETAADLGVELGMPARTRDHDRDLQPGCGSSRGSVFSQERAVAPRTQGPACRRRPTGPRRRDGHQDRDRGVHPWGPAHNSGRGGPPCVRPADPAAVRRGAGSVRHSRRGLR